MGLDISDRRPIAVLAARAAASGVTAPSTHTCPYAPPIVGHADDTNVADDVAELCIGILRGVLLGEDFTPVRHRLALDLVSWSPHLFAVSRDQLLCSVNATEMFGETLSEVALEVTDISSARHRVYVEWRLTARFTSPEFIDDDLLIEPTGRLLETAGIQVVSFSDDVVVAVHCYYDDLALFEQLITSY